MNGEVELERELRFVVAPRTGGSIARWDHGGGERRALLRGAQSPASALDAACFPLVPFCNRIRGGIFIFRGEQVRLTPNMAGDPSPIYGQGRQTAWTVELARTAEAELVYRREAGVWPSRDGARQRFALDDGGPSASLRCRNLSDRSMSSGLSFHPYLLCAAATRLTSDVAPVSTVDADVLPVERVPG